MLGRREPAGTEKPGLVQCPLPLLDFFFKIFTDELTFDLTETQQLERTVLMARTARRTLQIHQAALIRLMELSTALIVRTDRQESIPRLEETARRVPQMAQMFQREMAPRLAIEDQCRTILLLVHRQEI